VHLAGLHLQVKTLEDFLAVDEDVEILDAEHVFVRECAW
jgi:hypothetical protein